jgi:hypothetical protein
MVWCLPRRNSWNHQRLPKKKSIVVSTNPASTENTAPPPASIIESYLRAWNERDIQAALDCFVEDSVYETEDPIFVDTLKGKDSLREHLEKNAAALPPACKIILDDLVIDDSCGTAGVKWHLEANGVPIPNLRGCSMYTMVHCDSSGSSNTDLLLLKSGFDVTESPVKLPGVALPRHCSRRCPPALFRSFL